MSVHLDEGTLQRVLDGELSRSESVGVEAHLAACTPCSAQLRELETTFSAIGERLALLDPPEISLELAFAGWRRRLPGARRSFGGGQLRRAAVLVLAFAGVASATIPGSPVRRLVEQWWSGVPAAERAATDQPLGEDPQPSAGVSVGAADGELFLVVDRASPALRIRVRVAEQGALSVRGIGEAADARFRMGRGRITVEDAGAGELEVMLPRSARRATITVDGRRVLLKEGEEIHVLGAADTVGPEIVFPGRN